MRVVLALLLLLSGLHVTDTAVAQSDFWQRFSSRKTARARLLARNALRVLKHERPSILDPGARLFPYRVAEAIAKLAEAARLAPGDAGIQIAYGLALAHHREHDADARQTALNALIRAKKLEPSRFSQEELFELAILYSREQRFTEAINTYETLLANAIEPASMTTFSNLAEMRMLSGDLQGAIATYRQALGTGSFDPGAETLARWGLGVALDRAGDHRKALSEVEQAVQNSGGTLRALDAEGVFFEPGYERHWYRALGYESLANSLGGLRKEEHLYSAELEWEAFVKHSKISTPSSPWQGQAEGHIKRIRALRKRLRLQKR